MTKQSSENNTSQCEQFEACLEILHLMLDNEATDEQEAYLNAHLENCMICFQQYEIEKELRFLVKAKLANRPVPADLAKEIKIKVFQSA